MNLFKGVHAYIQAFLTSALQALLSSPVSAQRLKGIYRYVLQITI